MDGRTEVSIVEPVSSESAEVMGALIKAVADGRDVATIEKLVDLNERFLDRASKKLFAVDFVRMKPHLKRVENKHFNSQTKSKYAKLEDINKEVDPILEQFGFSTSTKIVNQNDTGVTVRAELWHKDGHIEDTEITMPLDRTGIAGTVNKTGPHALASSIKYARRVAICALLNISTGDGEDNDGNAEAETVDTEKAAEIDLLIREVGADKYAFLQFIGVDDVRNIKAKDYNNAIAALKKKGNKNGK